MQNIPVQSQMNQLIETSSFQTPKSEMSHDKAGDIRHERFGGQSQTEYEVQASESQTMQMDQLNKGNTSPNSAMSREESALDQKEK